MPAVSVIMNCYNSARYLREALDSVFAQTFRDWEVVFWDNASTDASPGIAQSYGDQVRYFRAPTTTPLGIARNLAIAESRGDLIAFLDCDDVWLPEKLRKQVALFENNPQLGLACTDTVVFEEGRELSRMFANGRARRGKVFAELIRDQWISMSSAMLRRSALERLEEWFDPTLSMSEEADLFYRIAKDWDLDFVDEPLTRWRVHGVNSTFRHFDRFAEETRLILEKHRRLYPGYDHLYPDVAALLTRRAAFQQAVAWWKQGRGKDARNLLTPYTSSLKVRAFRLLSYFPGRCFEPLARLYFALPRALRR